MRTLIAILFSTVLGVAQQPGAKAYIRFNPENLLIAPNPEKGEGPKFNVGYLDSWIEVLSWHARNYPPRFASEQDKNQAYRDLELLSKQLDILNDSPEPVPDFLRRAGFVNSMAHNLDVPGAASKAVEYFTKLLKIRPDDPQGNYMFGAFLGGVGKAEAALPYLSKADSLGVVDAAYGLGMAYLMRGDNKRAIEYFEKYSKLAPDDKSISALLEAIKSGRVGVKHVEGKS